MSGELPKSSQRKIDDLKSPHEDSGQLTARTNTQYEEEVTVNLESDEEDQPPPPPPKTAAEKRKESEKKKNEESASESTAIFFKYYIFLEVKLLICLIPLFLYHCLQNDIELGLRYGFILWQILSIIGDIIWHFKSLYKKSDKLRIHLCVSQILHRLCLTVTAYLLLDGKVNGHDKSMIIFIFFTFIFINLGMLANIGYQMSNNKKFQLIFVMRFIVELYLTIQYIAVFLKLTNSYDLDWVSVLSQLWLFCALLAGGTFCSFLILICRLVSSLCVDISRHDLLTSYFGAVMMITNCMTVGLLLRLGSTLKYSSDREQIIVLIVLLGIGILALSTLLINYRSTK